MSAEEYKRSAQAYRTALIDESDRRVKAERKLHEARLQLSGARRSLESMRDAMVTEQTRLEQLPTRPLDPGNSYLAGWEGGQADALRTQAHVVEKTLQKPEFAEPKEEKP